jgi:capsular polysaccharide export protein
MLQGHPSGFWGELGDQFRAAGHRVTKVNFCLADRLFWGRRPALSYRGRFAGWPDRLAKICAAEGITDILYYADQLPYHIAARQFAETQGIRPWAIEFGYLRPDWLTLEPYGMGRVSRFPRDRADIEALAEGQAEPDMRPRYLHGFGAEAFGEVAFNLSMVAGRVIYPFYRSDKPRSPVIDYLAWLPQLMREKRDLRQADKIEGELVATEVPFNLVAMQMRDDYQIRGSSDYVGLADFLDEVLTSFARHAPTERRLVIKLHPLESSLPRWPSRIAAMVEAKGLSGRVSVIRGGDLNRLLAMSQGVVLVNSTVGMHALAADVPVCARGTAVYDLPGLTHQGGLDRFWASPDPVDRDYFAMFRRALTTIQVKGSFYNPDGRAHAIAEIVQRFGQGHSSGSR